MTAMPQTRRALLEAAQRHYQRGGGNPLPARGEPRGGGPGAVCVHSSSAAHRAFVGAITVAAVLLLSAGEARPAQPTHSRF